MDLKYYLECVYLLKYILTLTYYKDSGRCLIYCNIVLGVLEIPKKNGFRTMQEMGHDLLLSGDLCYSEFERVLQSN